MSLLVTTANSAHPVFGWLCLVAILGISVLSVSVFSWLSSLPLFKVGTPFYPGMVTGTKWSVLPAEALFYFIYTEPFFVQERLQDSNIQLLFSVRSRSAKFFHLKRSSKMSVWKVGDDACHSIGFCSELTS